MAWLLALLPRRIGSWWQPLFHLSRGPRLGNLILLDISHQRLAGARASHTNVGRRTTSHSPGVAWARHLPITPIKSATGHRFLPIPNHAHKECIFQTRDGEQNTSVWVVPKNTGFSTVCSNLTPLCWIVTHRLNHWVNRQREFMIPPTQ